MHVKSSKIIGFFYAQESLFKCLTIKIAKIIGRGFAKILVNTFTYWNYFFHFTYERAGITMYYHIDQIDPRHFFK